MIKVGTFAGSCGMGDVLMLTAVCKKTPAIIELHPKAEKYLRFFKGITEGYKITETPFTTPDVGTGLFTQTKLRYYGLPTDDHLPYVRVYPEDIEEGKRLVSQYNNPIVFVANTANNASKERELPQIFWQSVIDKLSKSFTILQFGISSNFTEYKNTVPLKDLSIESLIQYYAVTGKYIGVDTGDMHLMLAVGGKCFVAYPPSPRGKEHTNWYTSHWHYNHDRINYQYVIPDTQLSQSIDTYTTKIERAFHKAEQL